MTPCQILVVDQDDPWRCHMDKVLTAQGYGVTLCACAKDGLAAFDAKVFDLVLSADELADMDGLEMIACMRDKDPAVVPVVMSGRVDQEAAIFAFEQGAKAFLKKPFSTDLLTVKLEAALLQRQEAVELRLLLGDLLHTRTDLQYLLSEQNSQLTRTERYLYQLLDAAPFGILSTDSAGKILTYNSTARRMYGYTDEEVIGQSIGRFHHGEVPATAVGRQTHRRKNGDALPVIVYHHMIQDERGQCIAELYVVEDRSERQQLEQQLLHAERLSLLGQMAPRIAHEFKTPLQAISGYVELAAACMRKGDTENLLGYLEPVLPAVREMCELIEQIANLGKPTESGVTEIDLAAAVEDTLDTLDRFGTTKYCCVERDLVAGLPPFFGDPEQIKQTIRNLVVNAVQAMEGQKERQLLVGVQLSTDGHWLEVRVRDTGPGIPPACLDEIFEPFFTTKTESKGTGLGLAIVKSVIDYYGGTIRVESIVGEGSCFYFTLPAALAPIGKTEAAVAPT